MTHDNDEQELSSLDRLIEAENAAKCALRNVAKSLDELADEGADSRLEAVAEALRRGRTLQAHTALIEALIDDDEADEE